MLTIADCRRRLQIEIFLRTEESGAISGQDQFLLIAIGTRYRDALAKEISLTEKAKAK